jgi:hypothetical protein
MKHRNDEHPAAYRHPESMRTTITIITLSAMLAAVTLLAQESPRPAGGGLAERFKQFDKNGDGKLTQEEFSVSQFMQPDPAPATAAVDRANPRSGSVLPR